MSISGANKLINDIDKLKNNWDERSQFKLKGYGNLSVSDLDTLELYAESYINSGGTSYTGLMDPFDPIKGILEAYGISVVSYGW